MRILIAEDDSVSRKFLHKFLKSYGECDLTVDGIEVVDAFLMAWEDGEPYDLLFLDIMMPKLDGLQVLKVIRNEEKQKGIESAKKIKVIVTTALDEKETSLEFFKVGCEAYITKPIDTQELEKVIEEVLLVNK